MATAVGLVALALLCCWLAFFAARVGGVAGWIVVPISLAFATLFGIFAAWAVRKRSLDEPALIIDESGIYDNISPTRAGRVRWQDLNRVWIVGPRWMPMLCIRPENVVPYIEEQDESRGIVMRVNRMLFDAPVVIPLTALDMPSDKIWESIDEQSGRSSTHLPPGLVTP